MKQLGLMKALSLVNKANKMNAQQRHQLQQKRLKDLVSYVKENSPYLSKRYADISDNFTLADLPATNKVEMMENFNNWITDQSITLDNVTDFMKNLDNIGRKLDKKYLVFTTSGSTGNPCVMLYDNTTMNVSSAISVSRSFARKQEMNAFIKKGGRSMALWADDGFYLGCGSVRYNQLKMPWKKRKMVKMDVRNAQKDIVATLNKFQPAMLGSYPTALELLIEEQLSGRLHISPVIIMTGGEYLSDTVRKRLSEAFHCYVQTNYSCTEGGTMSCECCEQHFHINDDWIIIEAVDENNQPVPFGTQSAKILLTNLANYIQPIIRFEITDRVILHNEPCACGNDRAWLEIEGRTDEILTFADSKRVAPLSLYAILKEIHSIKRFQVVQKRVDLLELRLVADDKEIAFSQAKKALSEYLASNDILAEIVLSELEPQTHPKSGKFKHIIAM